MVKQVCVFLADGFEEIEALAPLDVLRRLNYDVELISMTNSYYVKSSHGVDIKADKLFDLEIMRETKKALKKAQREFVEEMKMRQRLIRHNTDFAMLEQFIQSVNNNPGLKITFTLKDGTVVELKTVHERQKTYTEILGEMNE